MATTAQEVFEIAIALMDEQNELTGEADTADTLEYKNRTLPILNMLRNELYPFSDTYKTKKVGKRPIAVKIESFDDTIGLDDYCCQTVLPNGLAAHLMMQENPSVANYFNERYTELKFEMQKGLPTESENIVDVYSGGGDEFGGGGYLEYNEFGAWG